MFASIFPYLGPRLREGDGIFDAISVMPANARIQVRLAEANGHSYFKLNQYVR